MHAYQPCNVDERVVVCWVCMWGDCGMPAHLRLHLLSLLLANGVAVRAALSARVCPAGRWLTGRARTCPKRFLGRYEEMSGAGTSVQCVLLPLPGFWYFSPFRSRSLHSWRAFVCGCFGWCCLLWQRMRVLVSESVCERTNCAEAENNGGGPSHLSLYAEKMYSFARRASPIAHVISPALCKGVIVCG